MNNTEFARLFESLTGNQPFPWQWALYDQHFINGDFPPCTLPTGLGKTSVIAVWLLAFANYPNIVPRRLVYVVNRRTVVDQTTDEVEKLRRNLHERPDLQPIRDKIGSLAISTLRGQFVDNREWSADPSRPAVIAGTVDMIGSRLLFSGFGIGFKSKPLHAGFLGQDALLVHDEAHLEPAFQALLDAIHKEQARCKEFRAFRVMELSATSRGTEAPFSLGEADYTNPEVANRLNAKKTIHLAPIKDDKKLAEEMTNRALKFRDSNKAVLVFVRKVDDVEKIVARLQKEKQQVQQLTGTQRSWERGRLFDDHVFRRFLPNPEKGDKTAYLVCTSAGEVGVNISAEHLVCDLSTFESLAQRFGRVNRFGSHPDTEIHVFHPTNFDESDDYESRLKRTLDLLIKLHGDGSPKALSELKPEERIDAFAPLPEILPVSDILFDAWAMTTIRGKLPGRPPVEPYLHGISEWQPPETHVAWREEVGRIDERLRAEHDPAELLEDYPLKPHEMLRDTSTRVFDRLKKLKAPPDTAAWLVMGDGTVAVSGLADLIAKGKEELEFKTLLLPPAAGGLYNGMLTSDSTVAHDVADEWRDEQGRPRRRRDVWDDAMPPPEMRLIRTIDTNPESEETTEDELTAPRFWHWYELPAEGDTDGSKSNRRPVLWHVHVADVVNNMEDALQRLPLPGDIKEAVMLAARFHDHGKRRRLFQLILGNLDSNLLLAKAGKRVGRVAEQYRHEFGSLLDTVAADEFKALERRPDLQDLVLHLIAAHHGRARPHFLLEEAFDPDADGKDVTGVAVEAFQRFSRLQRTYGRWGLAYLESLLRAADYAASANPSAFVEDQA